MYRSWIRTRVAIFNMVFVRKLKGRRFKVPVCFVYVSKWAPKVQLGLQVRLKLTMDIRVKIAQRQKCAVFLR